MKTIGGLAFLSLLVFNPLNSLTNETNSAKVIEIENKSTDALNIYSDPKTGIYLDLKNYTQPYSSEKTDRGITFSIGLKF